MAAVRAAMAVWTSLHTGPGFLQAHFDSFFCEER